jgi:3-deoxy-manno-octulosonate cytidylyltransferase (CMP-KDO synthetase)
MTWSALDALRERKTTTPFSGTLCVRTPDGAALWFSKVIIPGMRSEEKLRAHEPKSPVFQHLGLYGYRIDALRAFSKLPPSHYEKLEGLEQLRFLENGMTIHAVEVEAPELSMSGIDSPEDVEVALKLMATHGDPHKARL